MYCSFAWFLSNPNFDFYSIYNSVKLTEKYDLILYSIGILNFILFINIHFRNELRKNYIDNLILRLSYVELFWGLVICYLLYFLLGLVIPIYGVALLQQLIYAPSNVNLGVFIIKILSGLTGYTLIWIVISLWLNIRFRNDLILLLLFAVIYGVSFIINLLTKGILFNQFWWIDTLGNRVIVVLPIESIFGWLNLITISILIGVYISKRLLIINLTELYRKGIFAKIAEKFKAYLSMYHYNMIGLLSQRIITFFSVIGLIFVIFLVQIKTANLMILANLYIGVFVPILFSFNQYHLIKIDKEAGMVHNNFLRDISYWKIIFNRWLIMLIPQLILAITFTSILKIYITQIQLSFIVYVLLLNIFCSILNLFISIFTQEGIVANLFLILFVYFQLREDVQNIIASNVWLKKLNIYFNLFDTNYKVEIYYLMLLTFIILMLFYFSKMILIRIKYVDLENS